MFQDKSKTLKRLISLQLLVLLLFLGMTICNEVLDLPHWIFGDNPTSIEQRTGAVIIEMAILTVIMIIEGLLVKNLYQRIRLLEGFLPICANCKKVRTKESWDHIDEYISKHSLIQFSHSICPDCMKKLYPEYTNKANSA